MLGKYAGHVGSEAAPFGLRAAGQVTFQPGGNSDRDHCGFPDGCQVLLLRDS
jgi:hypothetical protein